MTLMQPVSIFNGTWRVSLVGNCSAMTKMDLLKVIELANCNLNVINVYWKVHSAFCFIF